MESEGAFIVSAGYWMPDAAVACQIAVLVQMGTEMELMVKFLVLLVIFEFIDRKICSIEGNGGLVKTIEAIDVTLGDLLSLIGHF